MKERQKEREIKIKVNGEHFSVPERITVKKALEVLRYKISKSLGEKDLFATCEVRGCYSCAIEINGKMKPSCARRALVVPRSRGKESLY